MAFSSSSSENSYGNQIFRDMGAGARFSGLQDHAGPSASSGGNARPDGPQFDIIAWYPKYQSCQRYFLDHAQHEPLVQAFAAFINICLPFQRDPNPIYSWSGNRSGKARADRDMLRPSGQSSGQASGLSLLPYIRRLVVTGMDVAQVLHGFFGDDWNTGIGPQREQERRNFLFAAKSGGWNGVKRDYDMPPLETVPFIRPLQDPSDAEIEAADNTWSEWLAMEDWMVGSRAPT